MIELMEVMKDSKVKMLKKVDDRSADELQKVFSLMNKDQVE